MLFSRDVNANESFLMVILKYEYLIYLCMKMHEIGNKIHKIRSLGSLRRSTDP